MQPQGQETTGLAAFELRKVVWEKWGSVSGLCWMGNKESEQIVLDATTKVGVKHSSNPV